MDNKEILARCDHTLLSPTATREDIMKIVDEGAEWGVASVCIPPSFVALAREYAKGRVRICTVIGFPLGYSTTEAKAAEARLAVADGADEIDMVIDIGMVKGGRYSELAEQLAVIREATRGKILKVIIECCLLTEEEKITLCRLVSEAGADFIKTSTGFSTGGATAEDVALLRRHCPPSVRVKAAGGISTLSDAEEFIRLGADRLGTSRIIKLIKNGEGRNENEQSHSSY